MKRNLNMNSRYHKIALALILSTSTALVFDGGALAKSGSAQESSVLLADSIVLKQGKARDGKTQLKALESKFKRAHAYVYSSKLTTYKKGKKVRQSGKFYYKDPNLIRFEVSAGSKKGGSVVVRQPDGRIKGKAGGLLGKLVVSLSPNSKLLLTSNGFNILKSDFETLLQNLLRQLKPGKKCVATSAPCNLNGKGKSHVIEVLSGNGKVEQRLVVDARSKLPRAWVLFQNARVYSITNFTSVQLNAPISNELFVLDRGNMLAHAKAVGAFMASPGNITYDGKELDETMLDEDMLRDMKKMVKVLRRKASYLAEPTSSKSGVAKTPVSEKTRKELFVVATQAEMLVDDLKTIGQKLADLGSASGQGSDLAVRWTGFLDKIENSIGNIYELLEADSVDSGLIYKESIRIEQETRRLDNIIFSALKRI